MKTLSFIKATIDHVPQLLALDKAIFSLPWSAQQFIDSIAAGHSFWLAYNDNLVVGYYGLLNAIDTAEILTIGVLPTYQRQGFASQLLAHLKEQAKTRGCQQLALEVRFSNHAAQAFYQKHGFIEVSCRRAYYPTATGKAEDALVYIANIPD